MARKPVWVKVMVRANTALTLTLAHTGIITLTLTKFLYRHPYFYPNQVKWRRNEPSQIYP
jgi:hypothetical protein